MPLNIKNERAHDLARQLAEQTGESLTTAVVIALEERLQRVAPAKKDKERLIAELNEIIDRIASRPAKDTRTPDEIIGYDENGLPS